MDARNRDRRTPLHHAALAGDATAVAALLAQGWDPNAADSQGFTALHFAAQQGVVGAARALLDNGAQVDAVDRYGNTPLFTAVFNSNGHGELIYLLRTRGADPRHRNKTGKTPLSLARLIANYNVDQFFDDIT